MSITWEPSHVHTTRCAQGYGMCVSLKHGLVIVSQQKAGGGSQLHMHSLADGSFVREIGTKGQFSFHCGGLCVTPDGDSVLVAERNNHRVQEVGIVGAEDKSRFIRFVGDGVLNLPQFVDCNADFIVVSENCHRISVFSWDAGGLICQFGSEGSGPGQLDNPRGIRLLAGCPTTQIIVADCHNHRLCVFRMNGEFVRSIGSKEQGFDAPWDVLVCVDGFVVANLEKLSVAGEGAGTMLSGRFESPYCLAALPDGGLVVQEWDKFHVFRGLGLRVEWISACVSLARK